MLDFLCRCITWGSNPPATLSWSRTNGRRSTMKHLKVNSENLLNNCRQKYFPQVVNETTLWNFTESVLLYHPRPSHHGHMLTCSAVNSHIKIEETKEDRIKLEIFCKQVRLFTFLVCNAFLFLSSGNMLVIGYWKVFWFLPRGVSSIDNFVAWAERPTPYTFGV